MPGVFIHINHYKVISRLLVFLMIALLSVGFHIEGCFQIHKLKGWVGAVQVGRREAFWFLNQIRLCLHMHIVSKIIIFKLGDSLFYIVLTEITFCCCSLGA